MGEVVKAILVLEDEIRWAKKEYDSDEAALASFKEMIALREQNMRELADKMRDLRRAIRVLQADQNRP